MMVDPSSFDPLKNATTPVGVPLPEAGATVAVITTGPAEPTVTLAGERFRLVVDAVVPPIPNDRLKTVPLLLAPPPTVVPKMVPLVVIARPFGPSPSVSSKLYSVIRVPCGLILKIVPQPTVQFGPEPEPPPPVVP